MSKSILSCLACMLIFQMVTAKDIKLTTEMDKISYVIGHSFGSRMQGIDGVNYEVLLDALKHAQNGDKPKFTPQESQQIMQGLTKLMQAKAEKQGEVNKEKGIAFLAENKKQEGVKVTKSGLQYKVIKAGEGDMPKATDKVKVHYHGTLITGKTFDSSYDRGTPAEFPLNGVIKGWTEGLQLMKTGAVYEFVIPSELAYGKNAPPTIGPHSVLKFKVELLSIVK